MRRPSPPCSRASAWGAPSFRAAVPARSSRCLSKIIACRRTSRRYERNAAILSEAPDLVIGDPTVDWAASACHMMRALVGSEFPAPDRERLSSSWRAEMIAWSSLQATERFASRLKTGSAIVIVGARHELLMESDFFRDQALAAIDAFIPGGEASMRDESGRRARRDPLPCLQRTAEREGKGDARAFAHSPFFREAECDGLAELSRHARRCTARREVEERAIYMRRNAERYASISTSSPGEGLASGIEDRERLLMHALVARGDDAASTRGILAAP